MQLFRTRSRGCERLNFFVEGELRQFREIDDKTD
jgi:hypothetical protein